MSSENPIVYLILGAANSGRREILANIIEDSYGTEDRPLVYVSESEKADPSDTKLGLVQHWKWWEGNIIAPVPKGTQVVYFLSDGKLNPIDQIEAFKLWILAQSLELARIFTIVNSSLAEKNPALLMWYDACIHFSDVVLMNKREGVANKWMSDFQARYKDQAYPCLFEFVKSFLTPSKLKTSGLCQGKRKTMRKMKKLKTAMKKKWKWCLLKIRTSLAYWVVDALRKYLISQST